MSIATPTADETTANPVADDRINPHEATAGFVALGVILLGEVLLILGAVHHDVPLAPLAQLMARIFGA
ncbi:MAG TPA: hypothetical protein VLV50_13245 [Stellaceae bacterium]|nr:hypothetical protein [Stellaceae bacterium]